MINAPLDIKRKDLFFKVSKRERKERRERDKREKREESREKNIRQTEIGREHKERDRERERERERDRETERERERERPGQQTDKMIFLQMYADGIAQCVYTAVMFAYPNSWVNFDENFKTDLCTYITQWQEGTKPLPNSWIKWELRLLEPLDLPKCKMAQGSDGKELGVVRSAGSFDFDLLLKNARHRETMMAITTEREREREREKREGRERGASITCCYERKLSIEEVRDALVARTTLNFDLKTADTPRPPRASLGGGGGRSSGGCLDEGKKIGVAMEQLKFLEEKQEGATSSRVKLLTVPAPARSNSPPCSSGVDATRERLRGKEKGGGGQQQQQQQQQCESVVSITVGEGGGKEEGGGGGGGGKGGGGGGGGKGGGGGDKGGVVNKGEVVKNKVGGRRRPSSGTLSSRRSSDGGGSIKQKGAGPSNKGKGKGKKAISYSSKPPPPPSRAGEGKEGKQVRGVSAPAAVQKKSPTSAAATAATERKTTAPLRRSSTPHRPHAKGTPPPSATTTTTTTGAPLRPVSHHSRSNKMGEEHSSDNSDNDNGDGRFKKMALAFKKKPQESATLRGPDFEHVVFNLYGHSPLVRHYMDVMSLSHVNEKEIVVGRTEIAEEPPKDAVCYRDVLAQSKMATEANREEFYK